MRVLASPTAGGALPCLPYTSCTYCCCLFALTLQWWVVPVRGADARRLLYAQYQREQSRRSSTATASDLAYADPFAGSADDSDSSDAADEGDAERTYTVRGAHPHNSPQTHF